MSSAVVGAQHHSAISGNQTKVLVREGYRIEMISRGGSLRGPSPTSVGCRQHGSIRADGPAALRVVARESDRVEMVLGRRANIDPTIAAVFRSQDRSASADRERALTIENEEAIERDGPSRCMAD